MASSLFCWTVVVAFVELSYESTASIGVHMCTAVSKPLEIHQTQEPGNMTIIKFDGIRFPHKVNNSTVNNISTSGAAGFHMDNTTHENISTTKEATQTEYVTSTMGTAMLRRSSRHRGKRESLTEWNTSCRCHIQTADTFMISVLKVWTQSDIQHLRLQLNSTTANVTSVQISESWNRTFQNTSVTVSIADGVLPSFYTVIMDVTGNVTSVTCAESTEEPREAETGDGRNNLRAVNANAELLFEAPLLIIGAVLAVMGSLLIIIGIAVWRRYRKERKRQAKYAKAKRESDELPGDNYEMITYDNEPHVNGCSTSDNDSSARKFSMSSASHSEQHHKDSLSSTSTHPQATHAANCKPVTKSPTPGKTKHNSKGFIGAQKEKRDNKKYKCADDSDQADYSEVEQEYEDISEEPAHSLTKLDSRVATPLAFLKPGEQQHTLKKTDNMNLINAKAGSLPHTTLMNEDNAYSHLDRLEKSRSHCLRNQPRDNLVANDTAGVKNSAGVLQVNINSSDKPKPVAQIIKENEGMVTSVTKTEEEQDHIYEALGEQEGIKEREDNIKPTSNRCLTTEPKSANDTSLSTDGTDNYPPDNKLVTTEATRSDLADNKCHDGDNKCHDGDNKCHDGDNIHSVGEGAQNTEIDMILRKPTEIHLDERGKESSMVKDNHATERPTTKVRESSARFPDNLTEAQAETGDVRTSKTDSGGFNNGDTNDTTQIIKVKDPRERKVISNYINIIPVKKSMHMDRQFSASNQATLNGIQGNAGTSNKDSHDCCDTIDNTHVTESVEFPPDRQLHSDKSVNKEDSQFSMSDQVKENDIQDARISHKDADANWSGDLQKSDVTLFNSNPPETISATELGGELDANNYSYCIDDDLESYTIIDNIVYESLPLNSCSKL